MKEFRFKENIMKFSKTISGLAVTAALAMSANANAASSCSALLTSVGNYSGFQQAVNQAYNVTLSTGFGLGMWATLMDTSGTVCAVYTVDGDTGSSNAGGDAGDDAWLGSRVISAQKASTANFFSLTELSIPTGAISATVYPGGSLYGLQHSNPVDASLAYIGSALAYGTSSDPLVGTRPGGVNVFGGGIALYSNTGRKVGAIGVSGDTSCRDAAMAYVLRSKLGLDNAPNDDTLYLSEDAPSSLFEQPACGVNDPNAAKYGVIVGSAD
jgi:uncharacterized protein GlcG (DUF336 family)